MPGRTISNRAVAPDRRGSRRVLAWAGAALALVAIGVLIGNQIASPQEPNLAAVDSTSVPDSRERPASGRPTPPLTTPTRAAAVAAAAQTITAFDGNVLLEPVRLRAAVMDIASVGSRARLLEAFNQAGAQTRAKLGANTVPRPLIVLRSVPVGYRVERFSAGEATVAVWYVGIVGSGATVQPQQSWRTEIVTLVWEHGAWKVSSFASSPGPTPPLPTSEVPQAPGALFATIPLFEEFERADP